MEDCLIAGGFEELIDKDYKPDAGGEDDATKKERVNQRKARVRLENRPTKKFSCW